MDSLFHESNSYEDGSFGPCCKFHWMQFLDVSIVFEINVDRRHSVMLNVI